MVDRRRRGVGVGDEFRPTVRKSFGFAFSSLRFQFASLSVRGNGIPAVSRLGENVDGGIC